MRPSSALTSSTISTSAYIHTEKLWVGWLVGDPPDSISLALGIGQHAFALLPHGFGVSLVVFPVEIEARRLD